MFKDEPLEPSCGVLDAIGPGKVRWAPAAAIHWASPFGCAGFSSASSHEGRRILAAPSRFISPGLHERCSKRALGRVLVVGAAAKSQVFERRTPPTSDRLDVIELERAGGEASMTAPAHERAPITVPGTHRAPHSSGDVAPVAARACLDSGPRRRPELPLLEFLDERIQRSIEHGGDVYTRESVAQQILGATQLVSRLASNRHLEREAVASDRRHNTPSGFATGHGWTWLGHRGTLNWPRGR